MGSLANTDAHVHVKKFINPTIQQGASIQLAELPQPSLPKLYTEFRGRKDRGHDITGYDSPKYRTIGFIDHTDKAYVSISLAAVKMYNSKDAEARSLDIDPDVLRELIRTPNGRYKLFGGDFFHTESEIARDDVYIEWDTYIHGEKYPLAEIVASVTETAGRGDAQKTLVSSFFGWSLHSGASGQIVFPVYNHVGAPQPLPEQAYFRRFHDRLFRAWDGGWDVSLLSEDGETYIVQAEHNAEGLAIQQCEDHIHDLSAALIT